MLRGLLRIFESAELDLLHRGVLEVLERTGLRIQGEFLLRALADAGCRVDFSARRAWFPPELVEAWTSNPFRDSGAKVSLM